ncbi:F-box protein interaction domain protein [Senna tora]|uniref:F-box protein interaction domain protein n=1 Tax=Senna tora TaxID=362788 RepID=A0A834U136_9FABA|nr:F-box protein interaction domain protein [Senna tora]
MNLSQIGYAANNTFVEVANYLYENLIGPQQAIKLGQQFMSAQNGKLRIMSSNNFQGLPDSIESAMGFHDSSEISIDRLMSYAGKMAHLFYNSYKAWYSKLIEDGYMIEDNEWTRLHATSKLGLELVGKTIEGDKDFLWDIFCCRLGLYPKFKWFLCAIFYFPGINGPFVCNPFNWYFLLSFWASEPESSLLRNQLTFRPPIIWIKIEKKLAITLKRKRIEEICNREFEAWKQKWQRKGSHAEKAKQKPDLVFIFETLSTANIATNMMQCFCFTYSTGIYVIGRSGGMIVAWNERTNISIMDVSHHWIHLKGKDIKDSNVKALPIVASDHAPLIYSSYFDMPQRYRPRRFEAVWMMRNEYNTVSRTNELAQIQNKIRLCNNEELLTRELQLRKEIECWLDKEKVLDYEKVEKMAFQDYKTVYDNVSNMALQDILNKIQHLNIPALNERQSQRLMEQISMSDVEDAIFNIKAFKSPGLDGFPAAFFHKHWEKWKFMKSMIFFLWKSLVYPTSKIPNFSILNLPATAKELRLNDEKKGFDQPLGYYGCWTLFAFLHHLLSVMIQNYSLWITMKRKTDSVAIEADEVDDLEIQPLSPSFLDLPSPITTNILLRLPIKSVLICKCVCKGWHTIISDPHFAKLHFKDAPADVMIRTNDPKRVSRTLHLLEFQPKQFLGRSNYDNGSRFCICDDFCKPNCKRHIKFEAKFKLPLRDSKMVLDKMLEAKSRKRSYIACKPRDDKFDVLNSCKGLLCLCGPMDRNPLVVCNPVTGEFIRLPEGSKIFREAIDCGFGYHEKTREFKVIRVFNSFARDPQNAKNWLYNGRVAEMHTLGTGSWKNVGIGTVPYKLEFPTSLNGALHWLPPFNYGYEELVVRFNFELERFEEFPCPVKNFGMTNRDNVSMGELNGGSAVLMYHSCNCLIYHERRRHGFNFLKVRGTEFKFEAFAHIPSLISLKDAVKGDVEVQNVHSRCSAFKLREENDVLFLAEESVQLEKLYSSSEDDDEDSS